MFEPDHRSDIDHFFILRNEQNIVGAVGAKVDESLETVEIGPLAVDPNHQVSKYSFKNIATTLIQISRLFLFWLFLQN
jgi:N-acetylglutamate synthase-like GNAT family acetyltransferase